MKAELNTERLILQPVSEKHCNETYLSWLQDPETNKFLESRLYKHSIDTIKDFVKQASNSNSLFLAIQLKDGIKHIGNIKIDGIHPIHQTAEYGILMGDKSEWGKGYAKEASIAVIDYCFNQLNIRKITLGVIPENKNALALYKKLGFSIEGILKKQNLYGGAYYDAIRMALFKDEWEARN